MGLVICAGGVGLAAGGLFTSRSDDRLVALVGAAMFVVLGLGEVLPRAEITDGQLRYVNWLTRKTMNLNEISEVRLSRSKLCWVLMAIEIEGQGKVRLRATERVQVGSQITEEVAGFAESIRRSTSSL